MGKPWVLAAKPSGKPSTNISSPGPTSAWPKELSSASQEIGMAALANSGGALMAMAAMSWLGFLTQSWAAPSRMASGWAEKRQAPSAPWKR